MIDPPFARTLAARKTQAELEALQDDVLAVAAGSGEVSVSFGGGSITVDRGNASYVLANLEEAIRIKGAASEEDAELSREPYASAINFGNRLIQ